MKFLIPLLALSLGFCAHDPNLSPQIMETKKIEQVPTPVPVPCELDQKSKDERPLFLDTDENLSAISDTEAGSRLMRAALKQYRFWIGVLEEGLGKCQAGLSSG